MNTEQERTEFEAWYRLHHGSRDVYGRDASGEYADKQVQGAFNVWQGRAALTAQYEDLLRQALEGVVQWVEKRPDTHPWDAWQRVEPAITALRIALEQQAQTQPVYRCHIDLEEGMEPDDCVLDSGFRDDCFYARRYGDKAREHCGEWKPIQIAKHPLQPRRMGGADGG